MSRLTVLHINIIGVVVAAIVAAGLYFTLITGANEAIKKNKTEYDGVEQRANQYETHKKMLERARKEEADAKAQYSVFQRQYMPLIGFADTPDRMTMMLRLFWPNNGKSWPERYIRTLRGFMAQQRKVNGIEWLNPAVLQFAANGPNPNTIEIAAAGEGVGEKGYLHYSFPMTVRGKSPALLMKHLRDWSSVRLAGVPVVEGFTMTGNTPNLTANYTVTLTIIMDQEKPPPPDPRVGGQLSGGTGGGFGGMGPGGLMGAPSMGPMGPMGMPGMSSGMGMPPGMGMGGPSLPGMRRGGPMGAAGANGGPASGGPPGGARMMN